MSVDSWASAKAYREQLGLPFDLLSDWSRTVSPAWGVFDDFNLVATRWSFLVDKQGVVRFVQHSGLNEPRDMQAMLAAVQAL